MTATFQHWGMAYDWAWFLATIIGILVIALPLMLAVAMIIYAERKIWAAMALRRGPNVVGPWGLLQSFADGLKVFLKETIIPTSANKGLFLIAPIVTFTVALIVWAVIPFQPGVVLADINVGLLYVLAAVSLGVYGVIVAGWASNSKYPFFSALRAAAQMVSYEVSIGFVLITVVLYADSFNLTAIVLAQKGNILGLLNGFGFNPLLFPMAVVFLISSMAETFRTPFDLVEAESELVAGHQTEYSSMSFALFWLGEYANVILMCALNAHPVLGRVAAAGRLGAALLDPRLDVADRQDVLLLLRLRLGEGDGAALPLRPADAARVEDIPAAVDPVRRARLGMADADALWRWGMKHWIKSFTLWEFVQAHALTLKYFFKPKATINYPYEKNPTSPALPRRACAAPLSQRRGALHRVQIVRGDLPGAGDHHRGRAARGRQPPHHALRHRHGQMHLLRPVPGSLPGGCDRRGAEPRIRDRNARGIALRQSEAARERRQVGAGDRRQPCRRCTVSVGGGCA